MRLRVAGYLGERDRAYLAGIEQQLASWGLDDRVDHVGEVDRAQKADFLRSLDVLSVPTTYVEPKGLFVLEALACGVPVVQPRHGAFPEVIDATGGGVLVEPGSPSALATALVELAGDPERAAALGAAGREATHRLYGDRAMAETTLRYYERLLGGDERPARSAKGKSGA